MASLQVLLATPVGLCASEYTLRYQPNPVMFVLIAGMTCNAYDRTIQLLKNMIYVTLFLPQGNGARPQPVHLTSARLPQERGSFCFFRAMMSISSFRKVIQFDNLSFQKCPENGVRAFAPHPIFGAFTANAILSS
jgi:hypothetical protein